MQPREPLLTSQTPPNEQVLLLEHVNDDAVFYSGKQHGKHLDLLLHLSRYSNLLLTVTGQQGSGKTHLKNRMLQQLDSGVVVSLIDAKNASTAAQLLPTLSQNLNIEIPPRADFDFYITEIRNFSSQLSEEGGSCLIIIDNAENLEQDAINLVLELATTASDSHRPHLALFGEQELFNKLHRKENITRFESVGHHLPLEAFNEAEARAYLEHRCQSVGIDTLPLNNEQFSNAYKAAKGLPGLLNSTLVDQLKNPVSQEVSAPSKAPAKKNKPKPKPAPKKPKPAKPTNAKEKKIPLWLPLAAAAAIALVVIGYLYRDKPTKSPEMASSLTSQPIKPVLKPETPVIQLPTASQVTEASSEPEEQLVIIDQPEVLFIPAESPLDLPDDTPTSLPPVVQNPPVVKAPVKAPEVVKAPTVVAEAPKKPTPPKVVPSKPAPKSSTWVDKGSRREATLMAKPANHYTLQMMGSLDEASVKGFIESQTTNRADLSYFESRYKGKPWYVVVYGDYADRDKAQAAIQNLPSALQKQRPWAKNFQSVQSDIRSR